MMVAALYLVNNYHSSFINFLNNANITEEECLERKKMMTYATLNGTYYVNNANICKKETS